MNIEIKKSKKPIKYEDAIILMEQRLIDIDKNKSKSSSYHLQFKYNGFCFFNS